LFLDQHFQVLDIIGHFVEFAHAMVVQVPCQLGDVVLQPVVELCIQLDLDKVRQELFLGAVVVPLRLILH